MKVDGPAALLDALRGELTARADKARSAADNIRGAAQSERLSAPLTLEALRRRFGREIRPLDLKVPANLRKARMAFIECILAWEFGDALLNDPQFGFFVRDIEASLIADPAVTAALDQMLVQLHGAGS